MCPEYFTVFPCAKIITCPKIPFPLVVLSPYFAKSTHVITKILHWKLKLGNFQIIANYVSQIVLILFKPFITKLIDLLESLARIVVQDFVQTFAQGFAKVLLARMVV